MGIRSTQSGGGGMVRVVREFARSAILSMFPIKVATAKPNGTTRIKSSASVIAVAAKPRLPPNRACRDSNIGQVEITIITAHIKADTNGSMIQIVDTIRALMNRIARIVRVRSRVDGRDPVVKSSFITFLQASIGFGR